MIFSIPFYSQVSWTADINRSFHFCRTLSVAGWASGAGSTFSAHVNSSEFTTSLTRGLQQNTGWWRPERFNVLIQVYLAPEPFCKLFSSLSGAQFTRRATSPPFCIWDLQVPSKCSWHQGKKVCSRKLCHKKFLISSFLTCTLHWTSQYSKIRMWNRFSYVMWYWLLSAPLKSYYYIDGIIIQQLFLFFKWQIPLKMS